MNKFLAMLLLLGACVGSVRKEADLVVSEIETTRSVVAEAKKDYEAGVVLNPVCVNVALAGRLDNIESDLVHHAARVESLATFADARASSERSTGRVEGFIAALVLFVLGIIWWKSKG
jgi:hypothetical protein